MATTRSTTRDYGEDQTEYGYFKIEEGSSVSYNRLDSTAIDTFSFLSADGELISKLKDVKDKIDEAVLVDGAFLFNNGSDVKNLENAQTILNTMIDDLIAQIEALHGEFESKLSEVRTEMEENYGWANSYSCSWWTNIS